MTRQLLLITALFLAATLAPSGLSAQTTVEIPKRTGTSIPLLPMEAPLPEPVVYPPPVVLSGTAAEITSLTLAVLGRNDSASRLAGMAEILRQLTPKNSVAVLEAYKKDQATGRLNEFEARMLHLRLGQVNGPRLLAGFLPQNNSQDFNETASAQVEGWASRQPAEAILWFNDYPRWRSRKWAALALSRGLAGHSLETAETFLDTADGEVRAEGLNILFTRLASAKGLPFAIAWAEKKLASPTPSPATPGEDLVRQSLLKRILEPICATYDREALQAFLGRHSLATYFKLNEAYKIMVKLARTDPPKVLEWMATVELGRSERGAPIAIWSFAQVWFKDDQPGILAWIEKAKDNPNRDYITWSAALDMASQGRIEEGRKLMGTIKLDSNRTWALRELETRFAPKAPTKPTTP